MLIQHTISQLKQLKLTGMAVALERQGTMPNLQALSFDERVGMLVDEETCYRENRRLERLLKVAKMKFSSARSFAKPSRCSAVVLRESSGFRSWLDFRADVLRVDTSSSKYVDYRSNRLWQDMAGLCIWQSSGA